MKHERIEHDAYSTPQPLADWIVQRAVALLGRPVDAPCPPLLSEPGCGEAAPFVRAARRVGLVANGVELRPIAPPADLAADPLVGFGIGVDYLAAPAPRPFVGAQIIAMNPPFKDALPFVERALDDVDADGVVAVLVRIAFLSGKARRQLFERHPPVEVHVCVRRPSFAHGGTDPAQEYAAIFWFGRWAHQRLVALGRAELRSNWIDPVVLDAAAARGDERHDD